AAAETANTAVAQLVAARRIRYFFHHLAEVEAGRRLAGWKLLEAAEPLPNVSCCGNYQIDTVEPPVRVIDPFVFGALEGVSVQVEQLRDAQRNERRLPNCKAMSRLFQEQHLPAVVT